MKRNIFLWGGVVCILAALLSSCTKDGSVLDKPLEADQSYFATVNIVGTDAMTRANGEPDFEEGEAYESKVNTIYLVFYDIKGNRISTTQVRSDNGEKLEDQTTSVNSIYKGVIQVDVKHGSLPPAYVTAFINPISSQNFDINPDFATLKSVAKTTRPMIISTGDFSFAMSKSVYYGDDPATKEENVKISATPLVVDDEDKNYAKQLFPTAEEALKALEDYKDGGDKSPVVDIYVERYAAKVQFSLSDKAKSPKFEIKDGSIVTATLTFVPEYWAVNAYESDTYIVKSFLRESAMEQDDEYVEDEDNTTDRKDDLTFAELNKALGGTAEQASWYWNSKANHRCYWAQTPAYYAKQYPRVADDILDKPNATIVSGYYALGYYSYEEMVDNADKKINAKARSLDGGKNGLEAMPIYARENTVAGSALQAAFEDPSESPKAAIPSVVMVGHYLLDGQTVDDYFYVMGNETNGYTLFKNYEEALKYLMKVTIRFQNGKNQFLFDTDTNDFVSGVWNDKYASYFTIKHPNMAARGSDGQGGGLVIDSRFVTIQLKSLQETDEKYQLDWEDSDVEPLYALINGEYVKVTNDNVGQINQQMLYSAGTIQGFEGGKAYFTIPIKHLGFYRDNNANEDLNANDKDFDWTKVQSGDFGLVRNHAYKIIVDDIKGLGNGIPDPNDPIVPPTDPEEYYIGARILVLNWAVVPDQNVVL